MVFCHQIWGFPVNFPLNQSNDSPAKINTTCSLWNPTIQDTEACSKRQLMLQPSFTCVLLWWQRAASRKQSRFQQDREITEGLEVASQLYFIVGNCRHLTALEMEFLLQRDNLARGALPVQKVLRVSWVSWCFLRTSWFDHKVFFQRRGLASWP